MRPHFRMLLSVGADIVRPYPLPHARTSYRKSERAHTVRPYIAPGEFQRADDIRPYI